MFPVVAARPPGRNIELFEIKARRIARKQRPGQFVIIRLDDTGERVPLTIADANHKPSGAYVTGSRLQRTMSKTE